MLHLDGSENRLPARGTELRVGDRTVGFVGTSARHHELGPIALAMVKRNVDLGLTLDADGIPAARRSSWIPRSVCTYDPSCAEGAQARRAPSVEADRAWEPPLAPTLSRGRGRGDRAGG